MNEDSKKKLTAVLEELKTEYLAKFPHKILKLKELTELRRWRDLEEEYHKLKGSGKTYGYPEVSVVCEKVESLLMRNFIQKPEVYEQSVLLLEKIHQSYLNKESYDLQKDSFARTLLALETN